MNNTAVPQNFYNRFDAFKGWLIKQCASGLVPARWLYRDAALPENIRGHEGEISLEIVSHCWQYSHLLTYQLSSLVNYPPKNMHITMTVYYSLEDAHTIKTLKHFEQIDIPNVQWNWKTLPKESLFRRSIGRNLSALETLTDWIWFTDCDVIFHEGCFDTLHEQLQNNTHALIFPLEENRTVPLAKDHALFNVQDKPISVNDIDTDNFITTDITRATGPLQITHGDVARKLGYCKMVSIYQKPAQSWCKALEDRVFRWVLGTQGVGMPIKSVYRIQHEFKGRYKESGKTTTLRHWTQLIKTKLWQFKNK